MFYQQLYTSRPMPDTQLLVGSWGFDELLIELQEQVQMSLCNCIFWELFLSYTSTKDFCTQMLLLICVWLYSWSKTWDGSVWVCWVRQRTWHRMNESCHSLLWQLKPENKCRRTVCLICKMENNEICVSSTVITFQRRGWLIHVGFSHCFVLSAHNCKNPARFLLVLRWGQSRTTCWILHFLLLEPALEVLFFFNIKGHSSLTYLFHFTWNLVIKA